MLITLVDGLVLGDLGSQTWSALERWINNTKTKVVVVVVVVVDIVNSLSCQ